MRKILLLLILLLASELFSLLSEVYATSSAQFMPVIYSDSITQMNKKYKLSMTLSKEKYVKYEPVMAKFELINWDDKELDISNWFCSADVFAGFKISDDLGNLWSKNNFEFSADDYFDPIFLQPGDTFIASMPINNWAKKIEYTGGSHNYYFGQRGYFPERRKYKVHYYHNQFTSNEVDFEINGLSEEDKQVLDYERHINGSGDENSLFEVRTQFPDNALLEYILATNVVYKNYIIQNNEKKSGNLEPIDNYADFFRRYPNSLYMYNDYFMAAYYLRMYLRNQNYDDIINVIIVQNNNSKLNEFLSNRNIAVRIRMLLSWRIK